MGSILVRGLDQKIIERLKERARLNGRSLQQETKEILKRAAETGAALVGGGSRTAHE
jgi:plasmid stability protein